MSEGEGVGEGEGETAQRLGLDCSLSTPRKPRVDLVELRAHRRCGVRVVQATLGRDHHLVSVRVRAKVRVRLRVKIR